MQASGRVDCIGTRQAGLGELFGIFLGIASTSFGGYMAMISVVQEVLVARRRLLRDEDVLDALSLAAVLPGPTAINVVACLGYRLRGMAGAGVCVTAALLPAFLLMILLGEAYLRWGKLPTAEKAFMGIAPAVAALIVVAGWRMCRTSLVTVRESGLATAAAIVLLAFPGILSTMAIITLAGLAGRFWFGAHALAFPEGLRHNGSAVSPPLPKISARCLLLALLPALALALPFAGVESAVLTKLGVAFSGMSLLMFGGGYAFMPMFQQTVVDGYGWVTTQEFVDAIVLGQVTPGPIMISAAFIGYKAAGIAGAAVATAGMFLPPAALMVLCARLLEGVGASSGVQAAVRGVRAATAGMVIAAAVMIGKTAVPHWFSVVIFCVSLAALMRYRLNAAWIVVYAAACGFFFY